MKRIIILVLLLITQLSCFSQAVYENEKYVPETNPAVAEKIKQWQNIKFGLLMHWGAYSQWGIVESWSLCPEEEGWCERKSGSNPTNYSIYKKEYEYYSHTFSSRKQ